MDGGRAAVSGAADPAAGRAGLARDVPLTPAVQLGGILVLAAVLRLFALDRANYVEADETFTVWVAQHGWSAIVPLLRLTDTHPPGFYVLMKAWISIAGHDPVALRLPAVAFGVASVWLTFLLMRRLAATPVALLAALLVAVAPLEIMVSQQAMAYGLLTVLALGATLALVSAAERSTVGRWAAYAALAACLAYTQYLGILLVAAHGIWIWRYHPAVLRPWGGAVLAAAVAFAPWVPSIAAQSAQVVGGQWYRTHGAVLNFGDLLGLFAFGGGLFGSATYFSPGQVTLLEQAIILLPFLGALALGLRATDDAGRPSRGLLALVLGVPIGIGLVFGFFRPVFAPRWFVFLAPFYAMVVARGISAGADLLMAERHRVVAWLTVFLLLYSVPVLSGYYRSQPPEGWLTVTEAVRPQVEPGDAFIFLTPEAEMRLLYYFPGNWPPNVVLTPVGEIFRSDRHAALTPAQIEALAHQYRRVWIVLTAPFYSSVRNELGPAIRASFHPIAGRAFQIAFVALYASNTPPNP